MITLFLMGEKGLNTLMFLTKQEYSHHINKIIISQDKNVKEDYYQEIINHCKHNNIPFFDRKDEFEVTTNYSLAISWRWLIKLNEPQKLIVLHDSLLPKLRGFNPLVTALINGHKEIGVTAIFASEQYDIGDIVGCEKTTIKYPIKIKEAIESISISYSKLCYSILEKISNNIEIIGFAQDAKEATYSLWRDDDDYKINWEDEASKIVRFINAVGTPYLGAKTKMNENTIIIEDAEVYPDVTIENRQAGKVIFVIEGKPIIVCGKGLLKINKAYELSNSKSILPITKFRSRFKQDTES